MKTLYLLRHAYAGSRNTGLSDFDRPLDKKGREEAEAVADYLHTKKLTFDFVMCSAALRAQETLEPLRPIIGTEEIDISKKFYNISEDKILDSLKHLPDDVQKVLYIGHNPGIAFAILRLAQAFPDFLNEGINPATLVGFHFSLDKWEDLEWGKGEIIDIFQPKIAPTESPLPQEL